MKTIRFIILAIFMLCTLQGNAQFNSNRIINKTDNANVTGILLTGLQALNLDSMTITVISINKIKTLKRVESECNTTFSAFIAGYKNEYVIYIDNTDKAETLNILSHELIHLYQIYTNNLLIGDNYIIWQQIHIYSFNTINYNKSPWEIEARECSILLRQQINKILNYE